MSYLQIAFPLLIAVAVSICVTPPHPPAPSNQKRATFAMDLGLGRRFRLAVLKWLQWASALTESLVIISSVLPSSSYADQLNLRILHFCPPLPLDALFNRHLSPPTIIGGVLIILAGAIRASTYHHLGFFFRFEVSIQPSHRLITSGPYSIVRHPSYTGILFCSIGLLLWHLGDGSLLRVSGSLDSGYGRAFFVLYVMSLIVPMPVVTLGRMKNEDEALHKEFRAEWELWREKVPYMLFPGVY